MRSGKRPFRINVNPCVNVRLNSLDPFQAFPDKITR
jgi:hypothetical protein